MASKSLVATWYKESKSFDKIKPAKTYAQAHSNINHTQFQSQLHDKVTCTAKIPSHTVQKENRTLKIPQDKVACPHANNVHRNNTRVTQCSVAGAKIIDQRQQDPLVPQISNALTKGQQDPLVLSNRKNTISKKSEYHQPQLPELVFSTHKYS